MIRKKYEENVYNFQKNAWSFFTAPFLKFELKFMSFTTCAIIEQARGKLTVAFYRKLQIFVKI